MVYFKANQNLFENIKGISFYCEGKPCTPKEVFERLYSGLNKLLTFNREEQRKSSRPRYNQDPGDEAKRAKFYMNWLQSIPDNLYAKVKLKTKQKGLEQYKDLRVLPRTNIPPEKDRKPNIVYLEDDKQNTLIMRLSKTYLPNSDKETAHTFKRMVQCHYKKLDLDNLIEWVEKGNLQEPKPRSYQYIPEPYLTVGLENMYKEGFPRITPNIKTADLDNQTLVTIRPMLILMWDHSFGKDMQKKLGEYLGSLYNLRISEKADRQIDHYAILKSTGKNLSQLVNYDPDFFVRLNFAKGTTRQLIGEDFKDFKKTMQQKAKNEDVIVPENLFDSIYETAKHTMNKKDLHYFNKHFLDFFPNKLENAKVAYKLDTL
ncbi:MAG: hypothetical protein ACOCQG_00530 [Candidatus Nanoarchaeia archaeon]